MAEGKEKEEMKITKLDHGTAFRQTYKIELRGEVVGQPVGYGGAEHEQFFMESQLREVVRIAVADFYQCQLVGTSLKVTAD